MRIILTNLTPQQEDKVRSQLNEWMDSLSTEEAVYNTKYSLGIMTISITASPSVCNDRKSFYKLWCSNKPNITLSFEE
jgi:hypothetical protein